MYYLGQSVDPDAVQAYAWMALANQDGDDPAWGRKRDQVYAGLTGPHKAVADTAKENLFARLSDESLAKQLTPVLSSAETEFGTARSKKRFRPPYPRTLEKARN